MTNVSLGTGRQRKTHHISYSCGHTAGFLVVLGVSLLRCHAFAFFQFFFFLVCSGGAIVYPELDGVIEICVGFFFCTFMISNFGLHRHRVNHMETFCSGTQTQKYDSSGANDDLWSFLQLCL